MKIFVRRSVILLPFPFTVEYCTEGGAAYLHRALRAELLAAEATDAKRAVDDGLFILYYDCLCGADVFTNSTADTKVFF